MDGELLVKSQSMVVMAMGVVVGRKEFVMRCIVCILAIDSTSQNELSQALGVESGSRNWPFSQKTHRMCHVLAHELGWRQRTALLWSTQYTKNVCKPSTS